MLTLKALALVILGLVGIYALWFLVSVLAYVYLLIGSAHPRPGWGFDLLAKLFALVAEDVERSRERGGLDRADKILRRSWWPLHIVLLALLAFLVFLVRHFLAPEERPPQGRVP
jgi:hypothetical protein